MSSMAMRVKNRHGQRNFQNQNGPMQHNVQGRSNQAIVPMGNNKYGDPGSDDSDVTVMS